MLDPSHTSCCPDTMRTLLLFLIVATIAACGTSYRDTSVPLMAKSDFDPERYLGLWYEIARFPVIFQKGCTATTATYGPVDADTISVENMCHTGSPNGPVKMVQGHADIVGPGQLKVRFDSVPFIRGDYVVLWVDDSYQNAVVGVPSGKAGWVLSRRPEMTAAAWSKAQNILILNGYEPENMILVPHS